MRQAIKMELIEEERTTLESRNKGQRVEVRQTLLARIILFYLHIQETSHKQEDSGWKLAFLRGFQTRPNGNIK